MDILDKARQNIKVHKLTLQNLKAFSKAKPSITTTNTIHISKGLIEYKILTKLKFIRLIRLCIIDFIIEQYNYEEKQTMEVFENIEWQINHIMLRLEHKIGKDDENLIYLKKLKKISDEHARSLSIISLKLDENKFIKMKVERKIENLNFRLFKINQKILYYKDLK